MYQMNRCLVIIHKGKREIGRVIVATSFEADVLFSRYVKRQIMDLKYHPLTDGEINCEYRRWK
jgi:hypothetical protein